MRLLFSIFIFLTHAAAAQVPVFQPVPFVSQDCPSCDATSMLFFDGTNGSTTMTDELSYTWTAYGNAQLNTTSPKFGSAALLLDGTGDYISTPAHADFQPTGAYTVDCWIKTSYTTDFQAIYQVMDYTSNFYGFQIFVTTTGKIRVWCGVNAGTGLLSSTTVSDGTWRHIAMSYDGTNYRLFINGTLEHTVSASATTFVSTSLPVIGRQILPNYGGGEPTYYFNGRIDEARFTYGAATWTASFTPPARQCCVYN